MCKEELCKNCGKTLMPMTAYNTSHVKREISMCFNPNCKMSLELQKKSEVISR